jgi:hypothetical protein
MHKIALFIIPLLLLSCTSEKPPAAVSGGVSRTSSLPGSTGGAGGAYTLEITPSDPTRNSTLNLVAGGVDLSAARITWLVNGTPADGPAQYPRFSAKETTRGDRVQAKAIFQNNEISSNVVTIGNTPPRITSMKLLPEVFKAGDMLSVEVEGTDADGDSITFLYEWTRNGEPAGNGKSMGLPVHRGDKVAAKVTPYDGVAYGDPVSFRKEIGNFPPMIVDHKEFSFDGTVYTYQVRASDPDGDTLTYSLESPLSGMTIDPSTGLLKWVVPSEFKGKQDVLISVSDGNGGIAKYSITITIH